MKKAIRAILLTGLLLSAFSPMALAKGACCLKADCKCAGGEVCAKGECKCKKPSCCASGECKCAKGECPSDCQCNKEVKAE